MIQRLFQYLTQDVNPRICCTLYHTKLKGENFLKRINFDIIQDEEQLYRSTVFWTPSDLKLCGIRQGTSLLMSHLGRGFVAMPSNQPSLIVLTLELVQR